MEQDNNTNGVNKRISPQEYALLKEEAQKTLDTLSESDIFTLRRHAYNSLNGFIKRLERHLEGSKEVLQLATNVDNYKNHYGGDALSKVKNKKFWLTQIVNFIAVAIFRIPREFTPAFGFSNVNNSVYSHIRDNSSKIIEFEQGGIKIVNYYISLIKKIMDKIKNDNLALIIFYNSIYKNKKYMGNFTENSKKVLLSIFNENDIEYSEEIIMHGFKMSYFAEYMADLVDAYESVFNPKKRNGGGFN